MFTFFSVVLDFYGKLDKQGGNEYGIEETKNLIGCQNRVAVNIV